MTLWPSPHPKESGALSLGQVQQNGDPTAKIKELVDSGAVLPSSATSFVSDGSEDAGFEDGSIDVDMGEEESEGIQIDCIQTLTEFEPIADDLGHCDSPLMPDFKTAIPLPAPPMLIGNSELAFGGNQAYGNIQNAVSQMIDRPTSPMQALQYWNDNSNDSRNRGRVAGDVGLNNIGNTCFMNSGLQCLLHTSPLVEFFVGCESFEKTSTSLVYQFHSLMKHAWFGYAGAISLHDFKLVLGNKYLQFRDCRQHDCQEFLAVLLDMLHEELKSKQKAVTESLSEVDSSVSESFIVDCLPNKLGEAADQYVVSTSKACGKPVRQVADNSTNPCVPVGTGYGRSAEKIKKRPLPNPVCKRLKLESGKMVENSAAVSQHTSEDVKRKSAKHESDSPLASNEAAERQDTVENEAEGSGSNEEDISENISPVQKAEQYWNTYMTENNTVVASTFQGMFKSSVTCSECSFISETYEPFMYLSLPIPRVMEKQFNVTFISMKDRSATKVELTLHLLGTVDKLIQEVIKKVSVWDDQSKYAAAEIVNYRVARVLDDKQQQLRNVSTNSRNIYVYELNDNFDEKYGSGVALTSAEVGFNYEAKIKTETKQTSTILHEDWDTDETVSVQPSTDVSTSTSSTSYSQNTFRMKNLHAPVGGGAYDSCSAFGPNVSSSSDTPENDNFNRVQCNICLEDFAKSELKQHRGCSCVLCEECLLKSVEHFKSSGEKTKTPNGTFVKCAVCLQAVDCKQSFVSLEENDAFSSPLEFITIPVICRNEPGTDANNNSSWKSGLFSYPWLLRAPSCMSASDLLEYLESINPMPGANHRFLSVKSDAKNCGQCAFSSRCNGCELPREGMISLHSSNSIMISYTDLTPERMSELQPPDMACQNELTSSSSSSKNDEPTIDIHDCLRTFSETEHLDEQNPWFCPRCKKNQRATKALSICRFPDHLIVYLKRFVFLDQASNKLNNKLRFPINDLDVSEYVTEGFGNNIGKYDLYSCVCHFGSASAGHYTAYAKNPVTSRWHYFNDAGIEASSPADNEYSSAYVLFYKKQGLSCNIPSKCSRPLPDLNSFNNMSTSTYSAPDTRGCYLPSDPISSDYISETNLLVDSTSPSFNFPHTSTEADLLSLDVDEGVGNETSQLADIRDGLGLTESDAVAVSSTSATEEEIKDEANFENLSTQHPELSSSGICGADSTSSN